MRYTWDPFDELRRMQYRMSRIFEDFPDILESSDLPAPREAAQVPYVDVIDRNGDVIVTADLPGVDKEGISISVRDNIIEISAEKKSEKEAGGEGYLRHERGFSRFYRAIRLPMAVDDAKASATFNNGVLEVTLPKTLKSRSSNIQIK